MSRLYRKNLMPQNLSKPKDFEKIRKEKANKLSATLMNAAKKNNSNKKAPVVLMEQRQNIQKLSNG